MEDDLIRTLEHTIGILVIGGYDDRDLANMIDTLKDTIEYIKEQKNETAEEL